MGYCTRDDIIKLLPEDVLIQLVDDEFLKPETIDAVDSTHEPMRQRIAKAVETADAEIDGYCAERYAVPFAAPVPSVIKGLSVEIAIYYLYARRTVPDDIEKRYDKAVARLKDIAKGLMSIPAAAAPEAGLTSNNAYAASEPRIFTRRKMKGF